MKEFQCFYDFFELPEDEAAAMIGQSFEVKDGMGCIYFPVGLSNKHENYGKSTGLISVSPVWPSRGKHPVWFRCVDDDDQDLVFDGDEVKHRPAVLEFMRSMPWYDTSIREVLEMVQEHVKAGLLNGKPYRQ